MEGDDDLSLEDLLKNRRYFDQTNPISALTAVVEKGDPEATSVLIDVLRAGGIEVFPSVAMLAIQKAKEIAFKLGRR